LSFLPDPKNRADIKFIFAKSLPYILRFKIVLALLIGGIIIEFILNFWAGLILAAVGTALSLIEGYANKITLAPGEERWAQVTPDEYRKVKAKQKQLEKWDLDLFDATNPLGIAMFAGTIVVCAGVWGFLFFSGQDRLAIYWALNCAVILLPHWITGVRSFLKKDQLIIKIGILENIMEHLSAPSDVQVLPMLSTHEVKEGGKVPVDARLMVRFINAPDYFLGLQIQVAINSVQGSDYPYVYCVAIAQEESAFFAKNQDIIERAKLLHEQQLTFEKKNTQGVDVLVIRQNTTKTSGYHTNIAESRDIVSSAFSLVCELIQSCA